MSNLPATQKASPPALAILEERRIDIEQALVPGVSVDRFIKTVHNAILNNRDLLQCTRESILQACMKAAGDGLVLDGREAALVVHNTRVKGANGEKDTWEKTAVYIAMLQGKIKRMFNTGVVNDVSLNVVYQHEVQKINPATKRPYFHYQRGDDERIEHTPILFEDAGPPVAFYSIVRLRGGGVSRKVMTAAQVDKIRDRKKDSNGNPIVSPIWKAHYEEMGKKTVLHNHAKTLPLSSEARQILEEGDRDDDLNDEDGDIVDNDAIADQPMRARRGRNGAAKMNAQPEPDHDPETGELVDEDDGSASFDSDPI